MAMQIKFLILVLLAAAFGVQVYQNVVKYLAKDTTVVSRLENRRAEGVEFPSVSVCPGFKSDVEFYLHTTPTQRCDVG